MLLVVKCCLLLDHVAGGALCGDLGETEGEREREKER